MNVSAEPASRVQRFAVLYALKPAFVARLSGVQASLIRRGVSPNAVSMAAIPVSAATALALVAGSRYSLVWLTVLPLAVVWMALNALDGSLARAAGRSTTRGAFLDEIADRAGDVFVLGAGFFVAPVLVAAVAVITVVGMELMGALGSAITGVRVLDGPMAKPDRAILLGLSAALATVIPGALAVGYSVIAGGAAIGAVVRGRRVLAHAAIIDDEIAGRP